MKKKLGQKKILVKDSGSKEFEIRKSISENMAKEIFVVK